MAIFKNNNWLGIYLSIVLILLIAFGPFFKVQSQVLFILVPSLFILSIINAIKNKQKVPIEYILFLAIVLSSLTTVFYDPNYDFFLKAFFAMFGALIAAYLPVGFSSNKKLELYFHAGFIIAAISLIYIEYSTGNFLLNKFSEVKGSRTRFNYNANYYSYITYFANFSLLYLHIKFRNLITTILTLLLPTLFIILSFITESRSGLLFIILINTVFWFFILKKDKNIFKKIARKIIIISISIFFIFKFIEIYQNSNIKSRISNSSKDSREILLKEAFDTFSEYPFTGVGTGQFVRYSRSGQFSHNSYLEILAEQGIISGFLLIFLFLIPFFKNIKSLRKEINEVNLINFLFFTTFILYNNFYVFYKASFAMIYFFLIISIQNNNILEENKRVLIK